MDLVSLFLVAVFALGAIYLALKIPFSILGSMRSGLKFRETLAGRINQQRLSRMLKEQGVNKDEYIANQRVVDIEKHIRQCSDCRDKTECDNDFALNQTAKAASYCPNFEALTDFGIKYPATVDKEEEEKATTR